jgi:hypothetical protein
MSAHRKPPPENRVLPPPAHFAEPRSSNVRESAMNTENVICQGLALSSQRRIMEKVAASRVRIAREIETARELARRIDAAMEAYLLGTKKVGSP